MNCIVGPLEQEHFAVAYQLDAGIGVLGIQVGETFAGQHHGGGDIVLELNFVGGKEVGPKLVDAPGAVAIVADSQIIADQFLTVELELMPQKSVNAIDGKVLAPFVLPFGPIVALDREEDLTSGLAQLLQPIVCTRPCIAAMSSAAGSRSPASVRTQDWPPRARVRQAILKMVEKSFARISATWSISAW